MNHYTYLSPNEIEKIEEYIRGKKIERVLLISGLSDQNKNRIIKLCSIYAISFLYPKILPEVY